jgi:uncharacterized membrane protein
MPPRWHESHALRRFVHLHSRLLLSVAVGAATLTLLPADWRTPTRLLAAWDLGVALYLVLITRAIMRADVAAIRRRAAIQDEGAWAILLLSMLAVWASIAAIIAFLGNGQDGTHSQPVNHLVFAMTTILLSWMFVHTAFTLHYAHEYYGEGGDGEIGGLKFPDNRRPDYWDFLYFSLVVAMTSQVSDVAVTSKTIRRLVTVHGVLSFFFNLSILALTVNMLAGALQ